MKEIVITIKYVKKSIFGEKRIEHGWLSIGNCILILQNVFLTEISQNCK